MADSELDLDLDCHGYCINDFLFSQSFFADKLSILNVNCQSLRNKFFLFEQFLACCNVPFDVICVTETWLNDDETKFFEISNYTFSGAQRATRGGGAGIYVRDGIGVEVLPAVDIAGSDTHSVGLHFGVYASPIILTVIYRQPSAGVAEFLDDLERHISSSHASNHIIAGDINIDYLDNSSDDYANLLATYCFYNTITIATHHFKPSNKWTCLDHILTNFVSPTVTSGTISADFSDHLPTFSFFHKFKNNQPISRKTTNSYPVIDYKSLRIMLENTNWDKIFSNDVDYFYNAFFDKLSDCSQKCKYQKSVNTKSNQAFLKPWMTENLLSSVKKKYRLHRKLQSNPLNLKLKRQYNKLRNDVSRNLRDSKYNYFSQAFNSCTSSKQIWQLVNYELLGKQKTNSHKQPSKLICYLNPDELAITDVEKANELNSFFSNIGKRLALKFVNLVPQPPIQNQALWLENNAGEAFEFQYIDITGLLKIVDTINSNKASGLDQITAKFMKSVSQSIAYPLCKIFNKSLETGKVPDALKKAKILPLHKGGSLNECGNFRPISILPVFSKILEKLVNQQIVDYLENKSLLHKNQFGFRRARGTSDAISTFTNQILESFDRSECVVGIFIDFRKAFDTIDHAILFKKLEQFNFSELTIRWIQSYLTRRTQTTKINDTFSNADNLTCGVPQGSVLGPTLFLIYINDLCDCLTHLTPILYADDTNLFMSSKNLNDDLPKVQSDLEKLADWCQTNKLTINFDKTCFTVFKNYQSKIKFDQPILFNNTFIKAIDEVKFLGVSIDKNLNWSSHARKLLLDLRPISGIFYRISAFIPKKLLIMLYYTLIHSKLCYSIETYGNASKIHLSKIIQFQKKIVRIINRKPFGFPTNDLFKTSDILTIDKLHKYKLLIQAHKLFYSKCDPALPFYNTRHQLLSLPVPNHLTLAGQRSSNFATPALWNRLPNSIRSIKCLGKYKVELRHHLQSGE